MCLDEHLLHSHASNEQQPKNQEESLEKEREKREEKKEKRQINKQESGTVIKRVQRKVV